MPFSLKVTPIQAWKTSNETEVYSNIRNNCKERKTKDEHEDWLRTFLTQ